jgi:hypothetical protein
MSAFEFSLNLSSHQVLGYYRGQVRTIVATLDDGRTIQFPASALQKVVNEEGVRGRFRLVMDANHKLQGLERV